MIADLDEFWFCKNGDSLASALDDYTDYDLIYVNWSIFGSEGYEQHPDSLRRRLIHKKPTLGPHQVTKFLVRPIRLASERSLGLHRVKHIPSENVISDNERFQINHYVTQSVQYFTQVKMKRGDVVTSAHDDTRNMAYFAAYNQDCTVLDDTLSSRVA